MSLLNQDRESRPLRKAKSSKDMPDFSRVGGLDEHLQTLRQVIIFPLLHSNVFTHFKIKPPRGVLFYGPPGTGKTLVAGALVAELNKEGIGKVSFFQRKGADVLDKWVGESEKHLRNIFEKATKYRPSIIFFDELDGLAPIRSEKNDQIHSSIVATLLSLMDGLDSKPGVIVIGATNRIEAIDPALRRKGRFDKELYFPLPGLEARKQIIQVHIDSWKNKPSQDFISKLSEMTAGFCGSDIQALCTDTVMCCLRRMYPAIDSKGFRTKIKAESLKIEESDFLEARFNITPSSVKQGIKMRGLSLLSKPLLHRQLDRIMNYIKLIWPHFLQERFKYVFGENRYAGRILIMGRNLQGINTHLIPSLLKNLEHLPTFVYDTRVFSKVKTYFENLQVHFPSVILLYRIDEWWNFIDECDQYTIVSTLEEIHAGLPILIIATCNTDVPTGLHNCFYSNNTIHIKVEDPNEKEREEFLAPLFFQEDELSIFSIWDSLRETAIVKCESGENGRKRRRKSRIDETYESLGLGNIPDTLETPDSPPKPKKKRRDSSKLSVTRNMKICQDKCELWKTSSSTNIYELQKQQEQSVIPVYSSNSTESLNNKQYFTRVLSDLLNQRDMGLRISYSDTSINNNFYDAFDTINESGDAVPSCSADDQNNDDVYMKKMYNLWKHAACITSNNMTVTQLELLYDVIYTCISMHQHSMDSLFNNLENVLKGIEKFYKVRTNDQ